MKISALELQKADKKNNTAFNGVKRVAGEDKFFDAYKFYAPPYDKEKYSLLLELCPVKSDGKGGFVLDDSLINRPFTYDKSYDEILYKGYVKYPRHITISNPRESEYMAYRFRLVSKDKASEVEKERKKDPDKKFDPFGEIKTEKYILDPGSKVEIGKYGEFTVISNNMGVTPKSGSAAHIFYDSFDSNGIDRSSFVRNHFNKAGGDLDGIVKYKKELEPYRYVMTNPYIGSDSVSSHKYWGENFFRVPSEGKFKQVIGELFREGKGYIADGAFTSQSIQSPMFQSVLKYGMKSPYYHWFKINGRLKLGVFPDSLFTSNPKREKPMDHIGFKIVNPRGTKGYNPYKPSYIQFFDDRLASKEQQFDNKNLIKRYANSNPKDHFDITTHQDSVLPYYFELDYTDPSVRKRFSGYSRKMLNDPEIKDRLDSFFSFKNFDIVRKGRSGGANFWDGNVDIVKMNLSNPNILEGNVLGYTDAREYLYNAATYWTQFAKDAIFEYIADAYSQDNGKEVIADIAKKNGIGLKEFQEILERTLSDEPNMSLPVTGAKDYIKNKIEKFRYETLDVSPQLQAVFAYPEFREYMEKTEVANELANYVIDTLKKLDGYMTENVMDPSSEVSDVLSTESNKREQINDSAKLTTYGRYVADILTDRIVSYAILKAMFPNDSAHIDPKDGSLKVSKAMKERSLYEAGVMMSGKFDDEAMQLGRIINKNLRRESSMYNQQMELAEQIADSKIAKYKLDGFQMAEAMLEHTDAGLNWRFDAAKDIGDLNTNRNGLRTFENSWDDVIEFWGNFIKNVRKINPSSYIVAEVTDLHSFYNANNPEYIMEAQRLMDKYDCPDANVHEVAEELRDIDWGKYKDPATAERMLYEKTGATTGSNYSTFFGLTPDLFGQNFENGNITGRFANMGELKKEMENYLNSGPLLYLTHSHVFVDNHDKPQALHCLALDMGAYLSRFGINRSNFTTDEDVKHAKEAMIRVLGKEPENMDPISSKAIVVGDFFKRGFERQLKDEPEKLEIINEAIRDLALGMFKTKTNIDFLRAESFGQNPLEISIKDIMEQAEYIANRDQKDWYSDREAKELTDRVFKDVMAPALQKMTKMSDFLNSITGIPFFFAGNNLGQSGYEYASKNISVANRNLTRHEWIQKDSADYKPEIKEYYDRMQASAGLYQQYGLSAIAGGIPVSLPQDNQNLYALLKYDDKGSNVLHVFSNAGMTKDPYSKMDEGAKIEVSSIKMSDSNGVCYTPDMRFNPEADPSDMPADKRSSEHYMYRKVYKKQYDKNGNYISGKFVDETDSNGNPVKYYVADGRLRRADGNKIVIDDTVTTFYKPLVKGKTTHDEIMRRFFQM